MSYKQGIPLLEAFEPGVDEEDDSDEEDPFKAVEVKEKNKRGVSLRISAILRSSICNSYWKRLLWLTAIAMLVLAILLLAVSLPLALIKGPPDDTTVLQSPYDDRQYAYLEPDNGLRVLLVSDPSTQLSAAAMDVSVGSFSDPLEFDGLAHFCEHMLFYGSKKYPQEDEYSDFLSRHGGYDNAYTSTQNTNYYFRVGSDYLREALDRFAQFFIAPILSQDGVSREVNAVDAEHRKNLQNDGWRLWQLLKHVSNPYHPFHRFNTGDLETLDKPDVLSALRKFYSTYYSANQMQLVIYGKENISTLTSYAQDMFSPIVNKNSQTPSFANTSFSSPFNGKIIYYVPVANTNSINIYWQVAPLKDKYREKISSVLTGILGHEGHGSALHYLKTQQLATSLSAGTEVSTSTYTLVTVSITLTQRGLANASDVVATVIQYIKLMQSLSEEQWKQQWNDFVDVETVNFNYLAKINPDQYVSNLASRMRTVKSPANFLSPPQRFIFDYTLLSGVVSSLTANTPVVFIGSKNLTNPQQSHINLPLPQSLALQEPIYGTQYGIMSISAELASMWSNKVINGLTLPVPNQYIPRNFTVLPSSTAPDVPMKIDQVEDGVSIWWKQDKQFLKPKVDIVCNVYTALTEQSLNNPRWTALTSLYTAIVTTALNPEIYPANLVGYGVNVKGMAHGVSVTITGYSDSNVMEKIINLILNAMTSTSVLTNAEIFSLSLESLTESILNYNYTALPYHYVYQYIQSVVMDRPSWKNWQLLQALQDPLLTHDALLAHVDSLFSSATLLCFVNGNVDKRQALSYGQLFSSLLTSVPPVDPAGMITRRRLSLSPGNYSIIVPALNPNDSNSVVNVVYQIGSVCHINSTGQNCSQSSLRTTVLTSLLKLQIQQSCFDVLRTKQQLGYVAYCTVRTNNNIASFQVLVQSGTYNASLLLDRIDQFLSDSLVNLTDFLSQSSNFESLRAVYRDVLSRKDLALLDVTNRLWYQIDSGLKQFNYRSQLNSTLDSVTANDVKEFYVQNILKPATAKKLVIAVYGLGKQQTLDTPITNVLDYTQMDPLTTEYP